MAWSLGSAWTGTRPPDHSSSSSRRTPLARAEGFGVTAHAEERFSAQEVRDCLDLLGCTRIDHTYGLVRDSALLERVRSEQIHVTRAWLSTA